VPRTQGQRIRKGRVVVMAGASVVRREGKGGQGGYIVVGEVDGEGPFRRAMGPGGREREG
jgi:hypothetical protein